MKSVKIFYILVLAAMLTSCDLKSSSGDKTDKKPVSVADNPALKGAIIKNDIDLEVTGVKLKEAYLVDADNNPLKENKAGVGDKIFIVIKVDTGWVKENDKSFIGASERILTAAGTVVISADDIFKEYETIGLDAADCKVIRLSAVITQADPGVDHFEVKFRVWDKKGSGEIKGEYKFSLK